MDIWIVDSGTSSHMTNQKIYFKDLEKVKTIINVAKSQETMQAFGKGCIEFDNCSLKEVLYVPKLTTNLLSVNSITRNGGEVIFTDDQVIIKVKNKVIIKGEKMSNGLFQVKLKPELNQESYLTEKTEDKAFQWHRKLGHTSLGVMKKMLTLSHGIKLLKKDLEEFNLDCEIYQKAKQTRLSFGESRTKATRPLQIVHTDLCGPIDPMTWNGKKYFLR